MKHIIYSIWRWLKIILVIRCVCVFHLLFSTVVIPGPWKAIGLYSVNPIFFLVYACSYMIYMCVYDVPALNRETMNSYYCENNSWKIKCDRRQSIFCFFLYHFFEMCVFILCLKTAHTCVWNDLICDTLDCEKNWKIAYKTGKRKIRQFSTSFSRGKPTIISDVIRPQRNTFTSA